MTQLDYATAGVNIEQGDAASKAAYTNAKKTFPTREGLIGAPVKLEGGFAGALDFGDFYVIQNDDGTGSKMEIAERLKKYDTIGEDLVAMVADDAICVGAEVVSLTNTFDVPNIDNAALAGSTGSLAQICAEQRIVIPGGEIAEVPDAVTNIVWNATAIGVVKKDKFITGQGIKPGHVIIGLKGRVIRSNGTSLARKILEQKFGDDWHKAEWKDGMTWGEVLLTPSKVFHRLVLENVLGDFESSRPFNVKALVHITGGGVPGNVPRILPEGCGARFENLHKPHPAVADLKNLGNIEDRECYRTWHCGTAMMIVVEDTSTAQNICEILNQVDNEVEAQVVGEVTDTSQIEITSGFSGERLSFS